MCIAVSKLLDFVIWTHFSSLFYILYVFTEKVRDGLRSGQLEVRKSLLTSQTSYVSILVSLVKQLSKNYYHVK